MKISNFCYVYFSVVLFCACQTVTNAQNKTTEQQLIQNLLDETPILENLHELCDVIGGRVTGTEPNERSVKWAVKKFEEIGVDVWTESFEMPRKWAEKSAKATVTGGSNWSPRIACRAFSTGTPKGGLSANLVYVGKGTDMEFEAVGEQVKDQFVLVETPVMDNLTLLFLEYINAIEIESNAKEYGALGVVYMSSREKKLLYRHLTSYGVNNDMPMIVMARDDATRCQRLLQNDNKLNLTLNLDVVDEPAYTAENVIAEIKGSEKPDEIIIMGAHLDSWGLGTGANDNGCNVSMTMDLARQFKKLSIQPKRTIRFILWNGEEQGMFGSMAYTNKHNMNDIKLTLTVDIGSGNIDGFFTNGRPKLQTQINDFLTPLDSLGPFEHTDAVIVGTDNYDFFAQGVPNLVGKNDVYNYCADYHSESDTYDKVNQQNLKRNTALLGLLTWSFANLDGKWPYKRHKRKKIEKAIEQYELQSGMEALNLWQGWQKGSRGRK